MEIIRKGKIARTNKKKEEKKHLKVKIIKGEKKI